jgi:hypothetical protein
MSPWGATLTEPACRPTRIDAFVERQGTLDFTIASRTGSSGLATGGLVRYAFSYTAGSMLQNSFGVAGNTLLLVVAAVVVIAAVAVVVVTESCCCCCC